MLSAAPLASALNSSSEKTRSRQRRSLIPRRAARLFILALALCHRARLDYIFTILEPLKTPLNALSRDALDALTDSLSDKEIGELYGLSRTAATHHRKAAGVLSYAEKHGRRRYADNYARKPGARRAVSYRREIREDFFRQIDTPEKAYWLGFLSADGWIVTEKGALRGVGLALHERDRDILEQYAQSVGFPGPPTRTRSGSPLTQVKFTSPTMAADLVAHGVTPRKSRTIAWPKLQSHLLRHYARGMFDGDGSVGRRPNGSLAAQLTTASEAFAYGFKLWVDSALPRETSLGKDRNTYVLRWYADNALAFAGLLYEGTTAERLRLERKYRVFFS